MKKIMASACAAFIVLLSSTAGQDIWEAVWAGRFYDRDARRLSSRIDRFFENAGLSPLYQEEVKVLISPHAAYDFSGQTAAIAFKLVKDQNYKSVVIIGPSHRYGFSGCSIFLRGGFHTPLGTAAVDEELAADISKRSGFGFIPEAHAEEHSVEVQIPFIQKALPGAKIVPVVIGYPESGTVRRLADALASSCPGKNVLVIASTDMSHFLTKAKANSVDGATLELIKSLDADGILKKTGAGENILCGGAAVAAAMRYAIKCGPVRVEILKYSDSAEANGDTDRVVGYAAAALIAGREVAAALDLTSDEKNGLLALARTAVEEFVLENKAVRCTTQNPRLVAERGAFVTLKKHGILRGCVGFIEPVMSLCQAVIQTAVYAATEDGRFPPVSADELGELEYEISVLSPLEFVADASSIEVGRHGLVIEKDGRKGLLLPQVAVENGWNRDTFLEQTCLKAALPPNAWKEGARIYRFSALIIR